jgi:hypothetical protein
MLMCYVAGHWVTDAQKKKHVAMKLHHCYDYSTGQGLLIPFCCHSIYKYQQGMNRKNDTGFKQSCGYREVELTSLKLVCLRTKNDQCIISYHY